MVLDDIVLTLICYIGNERYAIDAQRVVEVIPLVELKKLAYSSPNANSESENSPNYIAGLLNYRGQIVPVIDLSQLLFGTPARPYLSTRIVITQYPGEDAAFYLLGLIAERLSDTLNIQPTAWMNPGIQLDNAPFLGEIVTDEQGMIQQLKIESLLLQTHTKRLMAGEGED